MAGPSAAPGSGRKVYLDWLRGIAVIVMVLAHATDAWTRQEDRQLDLYGYTVFIAGLAAPLFLFLAGLTLTMAASARAVKVGHSAAASYARWRALQIFALALIFRLQSQLLGWGPLVNFFKVDILNVMGIAMLAAAIIWTLSASRPGRILLFAIATGLVAMTTPLVREAAMLAVLPDAIEAYIRPLAGRTTFAIFPWAAFLLCGTIAGELIHAAKTGREERRLQVGFAVAGLAGGVTAYWLSFQPSIYANASFWTSSPTFFFMRLGLNTLLLPIGWSIEKFHAFARRQWHTVFTAPDVPGRVIQTLGRSSLFVYWVHVEMVYGITGRPFRRLLPIELSLLATVALCGLLYAIVRWKDRKMAGVELTGAWRILAPVLR
jgi:uncharacterized membrane protein